LGLTHTSNEVVLFTVESIFFTYGMILWFVPGKSGSLRNCDFRAWQSIRFWKV